MGKVEEGQLPSRIFRRSTEIVKVFQVEDEPNATCL